MRIFNSIIGTLATTHSMQSSQRAIAKALERLSTGKRVNSPSDDSAAYSTGVNLQAQARGMANFVRSLNSSKGMLETADVALQSQKEIVHKMRDLTHQASNSALSAGERQSIQTQLASLMDEFKSITNSTEFNGHRLLDGSFGGFNLNSGSGQGIRFDLPSSTMDDVFQSVNGSGLFSLRSTRTLAVQPQDTRVGDFNGDGFQDMVVSSASGVNQVLFNNGQGGFGQSVTFAGGSEAQIQVADVNGDGLDDIISSTATDQIGVYISDGSNGFTLQSTFALPAAGLPYDISVGDFDEDGDVDLVFADSSSFAVYLGSGTGTFTATTSYASSSARAVEVGDFNQDGHLDFVGANFSTNTITTYTGDGTGLFTAASTYTASGGITELAVGDFNDDGTIRRSGFCSNRESNIYSY